MVPPPPDGEGRRDGEWQNENENEQWRVRWGARESSHLPSMRNLKIRTETEGATSKKPASQARPRLNCCTSAKFACGACACGANYPSQSAQFRLRRRHLSPGWFKCLRRKLPHPGTREASVCVEGGNLTGSVREPRQAPPDAHPATSKTNPKHKSAEMNCRHPHHARPAALCSESAALWGFRAFRARVPSSGLGRLDKSES